jgi:hypothetical protein
MIHQVSFVGRAFFERIQIIKRKTAQTRWLGFFLFLSWENIYWLVALQWPIGCPSQPKRNWFPDDTPSCGSVTVTLPFIPKGNNFVGYTHSHKKKETLASLDCPVDILDTESPKELKGVTCTHH